MTAKETMNRNIGLTFDFLRQVLKSPDLLNEIPDGSTLEFVEKDFSHVEKSPNSKTDSIKKRANRKYLKVKSELELVKK